MTRKIFRIAISLGILTFLALRTDWQQLEQAFSRLRFALWFAALGTYLLVQALSSWRWRVLAKPLGFQGSILRFARIYFIGMFFNLFFPTSVGGDGIRAWYLDNGTGRLPKAVVAVLADRVCGLSILLLIACAGAIAYPYALPSEIRWIIWGTAGSLPACLLLFAALSKWFLAPRWLPLGLSNVQKFALVIQSYRRSPGLLRKSLALSIVVQVGNVLLVWLLGMALCLPIPAVYYCIFVPMVSLLTVIPISLNGMGVREAGTALFLQPLGISGEAAICLAVVWFSVCTVASMFGGLIYFTGLYPRPEVEINHGCIGGDSHQGRTGQSAAAA